MVVKRSDNILKKIDAYPVLLFVTAAFFTRVAIVYVFNWLSVFVRHKPINHEAARFSTIAEELFMVLAVAPLAETFLFQYLPFYFLQQKIADVYIIVIAAIIFSLGHTYNWLYFLNAFLAGLLYGLVYAGKAKSGKGFFYACLLHFLYNGFASVMNH
jgi:membrane protease YdiL (CAAX protease family)